MTKVIEWFGFGAGILLVLAVAGSMMRTLIVPRGLSSKLGAMVGVVVRRSFLFVANRFETYEAKDRILALQAPTFLLALLLTWMTAFWIAWGLMLWPFSEITFANALRESGSAMLTLGFDQPQNPNTFWIHFGAATTGLVVIALQIAYLPTLYSSFNRRETLVTVLQSRAGSPAWGPEILARHAMTELVPDLPSFYSEWERWEADVAETHTNYIVLLYFRSPHALRSWLIAMLAVMDSAAMYAALCPESAPVQARLCLRMGFTCLRSIAGVLGLPYDPDPMPDDPIELTFDEFKGSMGRLVEMDFPMERTPEEAWPHFQGWRVNYESIAYQLADLIVAPPAPWSGHRTHLADVTIVPQRPANRQPDNPKRDEPHHDKIEWQA
ncbi:MAG: hypothetical protein ACRDJ2_03320 [Actinomycetota bacterium]